LERERGRKNSRSLNMDKKKGEVLFLVLNFQKVRIIFVPISIGAGLFLAVDNTT
jgi:hypothetical protein